MKGFLAVDSFSYICLTRSLCKFLISFTDVPFMVIFFWRWDLLRHGDSSEGVVRMHARCRKCALISSDCLSCSSTYRQGHWQLDQGGGGSSLVCIMWILQPRRLQWRPFPDRWWLPWSVYDEHLQVSFGSPSIPQKANSFAIWFCIQIFFLSQWSTTGILALDFYPHQLLVLRLSWSCIHSWSGLPFPFGQPRGVVATVHYELGWSVFFSCPRCSNLLHMLLFLVCLWMKLNNSVCKKNLDVV